MLLSKISFLLFFLSFEKETKTHYTVGRKDLLDLESFDQTNYLFELLTGESSRTLCVGQKITVKVIK